MVPVNDHATGIGLSAGAQIFKAHVIPNMTMGTTPEKPNPPTIRTRKFAIANIFPEVNRNIVHHTMFNVLQLTGRQIYLCQPEKTDSCIMRLTIGRSQRMLFASKKAS